MESSPEEEDSVVGFLWDDLADIYRDIVGGLQLFDLGKVDDAVWEWRFNFWIHWGDHATSAIRAIHAWLQKQR